MKPVDLKSNTHIKFMKENNNKDPNFKPGDHIRRSRYKNLFAKSCTPNSVIEKLKNSSTGICY